MDSVRRYRRGSAITRISVAGRNVRRCGGGILFSWIVGVIAAIIDYALFGENTHVLYSLAGLGLLLPSIGSCQSAVCTILLAAMVFASWFDPARWWNILIVCTGSRTPGPISTVLIRFTGDLPTPRNKIQKTAPERIIISLITLGFFLSIVQIS